MLSGVRMPSHWREDLLSIDKKGQRAPPAVEASTPTGRPAVRASRSLAPVEEAHIGGAVRIGPAMLPCLAIGDAISAAIDITLGPVPLTISTMGYTAVVKSADETRWAVIEAAVNAIPL